MDSKLVLVVLVALSVCVCHAKPNIFNVEQKEKIASTLR